MELESYGLILTPTRQNIIQYSTTNYNNNLIKKVYSTYTLFRSGLVVYTAPRLYITAGSITESLLENILPCSADSGIAGMVYFI